MKVICLKNLSVKSGDFLAGQEADFDEALAKDLVKRGLAKVKEEQVPEKKEDDSKQVNAPKKGGNGKRGKK